MIKLYSLFLSTYFCFDPFKSPYGCYNIRLELINKPKLDPKYFRPILGYHQVCVYCKSYATFSTTLQLCKN